MSDWTIVVKLQTDDPHHARLTILNALKRERIQARTTTIETTAYQAAIKPPDTPRLRHIATPEHEARDRRPNKRLR